MTLKKIQPLLFLLLCLVFFACSRTEKHDEENTEPVLTEDSVLENSAPNLDSASSSPEYPKQVEVQQPEQIEVDTQVTIEPQVSTEKAVEEIKISYSNPEPPKFKTPEPEISKTPTVKPEVPKKASESSCPSSIRPLLDFDNKHGLLSCVISPETTSYRYYLVISKSKNFSGANIVKSFDLKSNSVFPMNSEQREMLKRIKEYANLYFRYEVYCDNTKFLSQVEGPLSISCRDSGECQIMR